ncbi:hypothetical protein ACWCPT_30010 [Streptomyces sp. NPDC002308]
MSPTLEHTVAARLPDGRHLIALLDPDLPDHRSPLRRALAAHRIPTSLPLPTREDDTLENP